jgi:hypothetical protein
MLHHRRLEYGLIAVMAEVLQDPGGDFFLRNLNANANRHPARLFAQLL